MELKLTYKYSRNLPFDDIVCELSCVVNNEVALIPRRVVSQIFSQQSVNILQFLIPQVKLTDNPLPEEKNR